MIIHSSVSGTRTNRRPVDPETKRSHPPRLRLRAMLAAGLVLGVGGMTTLAAWTDTENATGTFGASIFGTESQSAGSPSYASNTTTPGATLTFAATGMSPGTSYYAWLNVRTTPASTVGGVVQLTSTATSGTLAGALQYRAVRMTDASPTATCGPTAFTAGSPVFVAGASATYLAASQVPATAVESTIGAGAGHLGFCFDVRVAPGSADSFQGTTGTVTWNLSAVSTG